MKKTTKKITKRNRAEKNKNTYSKSFRLIVIQLVVVLLIIAAAVISSAIYSNGFESFEPLYASRDGRIVSDIKVCERGVKLQIKRAGFEKDVSDVSMDILPNPEYDFNYTIDGRNYRYGRNTDSVMKYFIVERHNSTVTIASAQSFKEILSRMHGDAEIACSNLPNGSPFILVLSGAGGVQARINLSIIYNEVVKIELAPNHVYF